MGHAHSHEPVIWDPDERHERRRAVAAWVLGSGFAVLAMAFPQERLVGPLSWETGWLPALVLRLLGFYGELLPSVARLVDLGPEALRFVFSALAFGACFPVMLSIARRSELPFGLSVAASATILLSPVGWLAGTLPGNGSLALLFALLCLRSQWGPKASRDAWPIVFWALAACCSPAFLWLLPAVVGGVALKGQEGRERLLRGAAAFGLGVATYLVALQLFLGKSLSLIRWVGAEKDLARQAVFGGSGGWGQLLAWGGGLIPGLGLGALAVASLFFLRRREAEARPPRWLLLWCALPLLAVGLGRSPTWDVPYLWLLPPALIGGMDLLARLDEPLGARLAALALVAQLALLFGALSLVRSTDPLASWRETAAETLREGDLVYTTRADHAFLLGQRWRLETVPLMHYLLEPESSVEIMGDWPVARAAVAAREGRRIVFDLALPESLRAEAEKLIERIEQRAPVVRMESE